MNKNKFINKQGFDKRLIANYKKGKHKGKCLWSTIICNNKTRCLKCDKIKIVNYE